jgi:15-cis-phytoene synthase
MKHLFDNISNQTSVLITKRYSTSFSIAVRLLDPSIRQDIYNIYGFVRVADEIVDSFNDHPQVDLLNRFEDEYYYSIDHGISTNPVINAFQNTVIKYKIDRSLVDAFLKSMRADLSKQVYQSKKEIDEYIYGSADVVGLMCLYVFVKGNTKQYEHLKSAAIKLGSAFQKVNFLRDIKQDYEDLNRSYFPNIDPKTLSETDKKNIIEEITHDFNIAKEGIKKLPIEARLGVYVAFKYYKRLLKKIENTPALTLKEERIRVSNTSKISLLFQSYVTYKVNL